MNATDDEPSQKTINKIGKVIFDRMQKNQAIPFGMDWFEDRLMEFSTHNDNIKINLFRFIDAFPSLTTAKEITDHLKAYLGKPEFGIPWWITFLIKFLILLLSLVKGLLILIVNSNRFKFIFIQRIMVIFLMRLF